MCSSRPTNSRSFDTAHTEKYYIDRLTRYMTITQKSMDHAAALVNKDVERLQPYYDAAVVQWDAHHLRGIPNPQYSTLRSRWYQDLDVMLSNDPPPYDVTAWCIRAFAAMAAMEGINMQELLEADDKMVARINVQVGTNVTRALGYGDQPLVGSATPRNPPTGVELIGKELYLTNSQTHLGQVKHTIIDFGHTVLGGYFYVLEYEISNNRATRQLSQDEIFKHLGIPQ